jgi:hypothetical protein
MGRVRLGSAKEDRALKSLLRHSSSRIGERNAPASADVATGRPGDGTTDAVAFVHLMLGKGSQGSETAQGFSASRGASSSKGSVRQSWLRNHEP